MNFHESLEQTLNAAPGAFALSLVGYDGIGIESVIRDERVDMDNLSAELTTFIRGISAAHADLKLGRLQVALLSPEYASILSSVTTDYFLLCVMERRGGLAAGGGVAVKFEEICALIELVAKKGIPLVEVEHEGGG